MPLPVTVTNIQATPLQYGDYIQHSDRIEIQAIDPVVEEFINLIKEHAARLFDIVVRNVIILATNQILCGNVLTENLMDDNCKASVYAFKRASRFLDDHNAIKFGEEGGSYVSLIQPAVSYDLQRDPEWIEAHKYGKPQALFRNEIGMIAGIRFVISTLAFINYSTGSAVAANIVNSRKTAATANVYYNLVLSMEAYACVGINSQQTPEMIINPVGSAGSADALHQVGTVGFKGYQTAVITDQSRLIVVLSTATL
jgi:N4-gp56 family major capsid protein